MEWLPIDTAPKDGSVILAYWDVYLDSERIEGDQCYALTRWSDEIFSWVNVEDYIDSYAEPTYWMPLPKDPE